MKAQAFFEFILVMVVSFSMLLIITPTAFRLLNSLGTKTKVMNAIDIQKQVLSACERRMITGEQQEVNVFSLSKARLIIDENITIKTNEWKVSRENPFKCNGLVILREGSNSFMV